MNTIPHRQNPSRACRSSGFTLIELMITVAIVAILAAIAYPSYRNYVIRGHLVEATNGLSAMRANMERYYQDNRTYASVTGTPSFVSPCLATPTPTSGSFTMTCTGLGAPALTTFIVTATGSGSTAGFVFTIDQYGNQTTTVSAPAPSSWLAGSPFACWITKPGGC